METKCWYFVAGECGECVVWGMLNYNQIKELLKSALNRLWEFDREILDFDETEDQQGRFPAKGGILNDRKLHEVCINHRLAVYIHEEMNEYLGTDHKYYVDIEFNRLNASPKNTNAEYLFKTPEDREIRPDIIVHGRSDPFIKPLNLLVIEAKKEQLKEKDKENVQLLMLDSRYKYTYGATIQYTKDKSNFLVTIYRHAPQRGGRIPLAKESYYIQKSR